ncbi:MAG: hypothetical protein V3V78_04000, partial [Candidatus Woesearchaeota archaeon]
MKKYYLMEVLNENKEVVGAYLGERSLKPEKKAGCLGKAAIVLLLGALTVGCGNGGSSESPFDPADILSYDVVSSSEAKPTQATMNARLGPSGIASAELEYERQGSGAVHTVPFDDNGNGNYSLSLTGIDAGVYGITFRIVDGDGNIVERQEVLRKYLDEVNGKARLNDALNNYLDQGQFDDIWPISNINTSTDSYSTDSQTYDQGVIHRSFMLEGENSVGLEAIVQQLNDEGNDTIFIREVTPENLLEVIEYMNSVEFYNPGKYEYNPDTEQVDFTPM